MLAELRARARRRRRRARSAAPPTRSSRTANTFGATRPRRAWRASSSSAASRRPAAPRALDALDAGVRPRRRRARRSCAVAERRHGRRACSSPTTTRSTACCWRAASSCRATRWRWPRTAASRSRCCAREPFDLLLLDMEMPEMDGFQVLEQLRRRPRAARPAGDRHVVARGARQRRALHRARRRGLPAQAGQPGAAEGAHRRQPREEAPARPAEGAGAPLRDARGRAGPAAVGLRAGRQARRRAR